MTRLFVLALLWAPLVVASCTRTIVRPVPVVPPPCLTRPAPAPPDAVPCSPVWAVYYVALSAWIAETEIACGPDEPVGLYAARGGS